MKVSPKDAHLILTEDTFPVIEQITAGMPGGFFIYRASGKEELIYANQALIQMYGCQDEKDFWSYTGGTFQGLVYPEDWERVSLIIRQQIVEEGRDLDRVDYRIIRKDGELRWIEDYGHFVHTGAYGDVFYVFLSDVTERTLRRLDEERVVRLTAERKNALVSLEHEATALKLIHEILRSGMWAMEFDEAGEMASVFWSDDFRRMLGYKNQADFPNRLESWSDLIPAGGWNPHHLCGDLCRHHSGEGHRRDPPEPASAVRRGPGGSPAVQPGQDGVSQQYVP